MKFSTREAQETSNETLQNKPSAFVPDGFVRKVVKNSQGTRIEIYQKDDWRVLIYGNFVPNGNMMVPELILKVLKGEDAKPIIVHSMFMSKRDLEESGISKKSSNEEKTEVFKKFVTEAKDKFRHQVDSSVREAIKELAAREKYKVAPTEGLSTQTVYQQLKDFISNPSEANAHLILDDIKDKGYIRPALKGPNKGYLIPDLKAINRVILDEGLRNQPHALSAFIARRVGFEMDINNRSRLGWGLAFREDWWADEMSKSISSDPEDQKSIRKAILKTIDLYYHLVLKLVIEYNKQIKERNKPADENAPKIEAPTVIEGESSEEA